MTEKFKIMIIDDSTIIRNLLRDVLSQNSDMEVISVASNGLLALPRIKFYEPDIIILDYEMPQMNGIETLKEIKKMQLKTKVIMFSAFTAEGAKITIEALENGAVDFLQKPVFEKGSEPKQYIQETLVPKIKALLGHVAVSTRTSRPTKKEIPGKYYVPLPGSFDFCIIGISTGGPMALKEMFANIPESINGSIFVTQHMPPAFTKYLALSLNKNSKLTIVEAEDGMESKPGWVYIAPGGKHMLAEKIPGAGVRIKIDNSPHYKNCKPSVNLMFKSFVDIRPAKTISVIMTGMGDDGYESMKELEKAGSYLLAQNEESCLIFGMPAKPSQDNIIHESYNLDGLAKNITSLLGVL
ncbi:MAG: chemotaxis-specific protein-glutamate methyltransferase CheB [Leptospirales bacterium]